MSEGRIGRQLIAQPILNICGLGTLLDGTWTVLRTPSMLWPRCGQPLITNVALFYELPFLNASDKVIHLIRGL